MRDGEIVTACQQSCPTQAIIFGNRNDSDSAVARRKATPLDYVLLDELNTLPRTSYAALIRNPNPASWTERRVTILVDLPDASAPVVAAGRHPALVERAGQQPCFAARAPRWWWIGFAIALALLMTLIVQMAWLFINGIGVWGVDIPVAWGFAIAEYVWWIALASGGTIVSALFFLTRSPWRSATNRIAESMLLSAAPCAGLMPIMHLGRPGFVLLAVPVFERDGRLAAGAQPVVVGFHLPALLHTDVDHVLLRRASAGPRDGARPGDDPVEANRLRRSGARLARLGAALAQPADRLRDHVGDHGADGDLGAQRGRPRFCRRADPGWHSTQFPPYFFFGAVVSGTALIIMLTILVRWGYSLQNVLTGYHLNAMAKVMLVGSVMLGYAYVWEAFGPIYGSDVAERAQFFESMFGFTRPCFWAKILSTSSSLSFSGYRSFVATKSCCF